MSTRQWFGMRSWFQNHTSAHRFIIRNGMPMLWQDRDTDTKCPDCWDYYAGNFVDDDCETCNGTGYLFNMRKMTGIIQVAQPTGNYGAGDIAMKVGGRFLKGSVYVYLSKLDGNNVKEGDRFYYSLQGHSYENELIVINVQPQVGQRGEVMLYLFECMTPSDQLLLDEIESVDD